MTINRSGKITDRMSSRTFVRNKPDQGDVFVYRFAGPLTYVNAQGHLQALQKLDGPHTVVLAFRNLFFLDVDGIDTIEEIVEMLESKDITVAFSGVSELLEPMLDHAAFFKRKKKEKLVFESTSEAVKKLQK